MLPFSHCLLYSILPSPYGGLFVGSHQDSHAPRLFEGCPHVEAVLRIRPIILCIKFLIPSVESTIRCALVSFGLFHALSHHVALHTEKQHYQRICVT